MNTNCWNSFCDKSHEQNNWHNCFIKRSFDQDRTGWMCKQLQYTVSVDQSLLAYNLLCPSVGLSIHLYVRLESLGASIAYLHISIGWWCLLARPTLTHGDGHKSRVIRHAKDKWRRVTISFRTGGQGHPTPINTTTPGTNIHKKVSKMLVFSLFNSITTDRQTNGPMDGPMDGQSLFQSCVPATKQGRIHGYLSRVLVGRGSDEKG